MSEQPLSLKEQAARMILGEIAPLLDQAEQIAALAKDSHDHLSADVTQLAALVTTFEKSVKGATEQFTYLTAQARSVQTTIARFESAPAKKSEKNLSPLLLGSLMIGSAVVASIITAGAVLVFERSTAEEARIGRAVSRAYPHLDVETRKKVDAAIRTAGK